MVVAMAGAAMGTGHVVGWAAVTEEGCEEANLEAAATEMAVGLGMATATVAMVMVMAVGAVVVARAQGVGVEAAGRAVEAKMAV